MTKLFEEFSDRIEAATQELEDFVEELSHYEPPTVEGFVEEAPKDGNYYARKDGGWAIAPTGGGEGGGGGVTSVNNVFPDSEGNVAITAGDVGALPEDYKPSWVEIEDKPEEAPEDGKSYVKKDGEWVELEGLDEAPQDGKLYGRKDGGWEEVVTGGGGGGSSEGGFPTGVTTINGIKASSIEYGLEGLENWVSANPYTPADISEFGGYVRGRWVSGLEVFYDALMGESLPDGTYQLEQSTTKAALESATGETFSEMISGSYLFTKRGNFITWEVYTSTGSGRGYMKLILKHPITISSGSNMRRGKWFVAYKDTTGEEQAGEYEF